MKCLIVVVCTMAEMASAMTELDVLFANIQINRPSWPHCQRLGAETASLCAVKMDMTGRPIDVVSKIE